MGQRNLLCEPLEQKGYLKSSLRAAARAKRVTQAEIVLWKSIESANSPADFQAYLSQYPDGAFTVLAKQRRDHRGVKLIDVDLSATLRKG